MNSERNNGPTVNGDQSLIDNNHINTKSPIKHKLKTKADPTRWVDIARLAINEHDALQTLLHSKAVPRLADPAFLMLI